MNLQIIDLSFVESLKYLQLLPDFILAQEARDNITNTNCMSRQDSQTIFNQIQINTHMIGYELVIEFPVG